MLNPSAMLANFMYNVFGRYDSEEQDADTYDGKLPLSKSKIRDTIYNFLDRCNMVYPVTEQHNDFHAECVSISISRGYITSENTTFERFIPGGVSMACNSYAHLSDYRHVQVYICLYTAFLIYLDDMFERDVSAVKEFNGRFISQQPQRHPVLDHFAELLLEMPKIWGPVVANVMTTSTLNLVTALSLEAELHGVILEPDAVRFPTFARVMSGASETYALFIFPPELALTAYLQALPDLMVYINNGNDILSFYKEESAGETVNRIHLTAKCRGVQQSQVLQDIVNDAVVAHNNALSILKSNECAYQSYAAFSQGYVGFHAGLDRYRLKELGF